MLVRLLRPLRPKGGACRRSISSRNAASVIYFDAARRHDTSVTETPPFLTSDQRSTLERAVRVDQAGEVAANWIYKGQMAVLRSDTAVRDLIQEMWDQEKKHLTVMNMLQAQHHARPTIFLEFAKYAGFGLGVVTALMGKDAAMACTEAVETVIGEHYDDQLNELECLPATHPSVLLLRDVVQEFRDDELGHLNLAVDNFAQRAPAHALLSIAIGTGCQFAVEICKRI